MPETKLEPVNRVWTVSNALGTRTMRFERLPGGSVQITLSEGSEPLANSPGLCLTPEQWLDIVLHMTHFGAMPSSSHRRFLKHHLGKVNMVETMDVIDRMADLFRVAGSNSGEL